MFTYVDNEKSAKIKVIGVGGAGGNAINNMIRSGLQGVKFIAANTDAQALEISQADVRIQLGDSITEGLGAGANPQIGREAALETAEEIRNALKDSHMVFITARAGRRHRHRGHPGHRRDLPRDGGADGGRGHASPSPSRARSAALIAEQGLGELKKVVDTAITIPNDRLRALASKKATLMEMFLKADEILLHAVKGITDLIVMPGLVNLDFADVRTTMSKAGMALMGIGIASGENRAIEAAEQAISHPLLEDISISGRQGRAHEHHGLRARMEFEEVAEASERIHKEVGDEAEIFWGTSVDESLGDEMRVTVIATGIGAEAEALRPARARRSRPRRPSARSCSRCAARSATSPPPTWSARTSSTWTSRPSSATAGRWASPPGRSTAGSGAWRWTTTDLDVPTFLRRKAD
ncbi:MAG: cell division protein FtsZ [Desulfobacterales bacterium]|nr:cell division protein FtsZ [Desulfobacterales bacterium]